VTQAGDLIVSFLGLEAQFIVRKYGHLSDKRDVYALIGQCAVDENFEWFKWTVKDSTDLGEIVLC